jgi:soluble lytic murein transglycosylase-like protein
MAFLLIVLAGWFGTVDVARAQVYTYVDENGITVYTDSKPDSSRYRVRNLGCYGTCRTGVDWDRTPLKNGEFADEVAAVADVFGIDSALISAVMHVESWFQVDAVSSAGAQGLMQLMPGTQARFGVQRSLRPDRQHFCRRRLPGLAAGRIQR